MRLLELLEADLMELQMRWKSPDDNTYVIAFRGSYWLLPDPHGDDEVPDDVMQDISKVTGIPMPSGYTEGLSHFAEIADSRTDVIFGTIADNELYISTIVASRQHPVTSGMIKKLVAELGLRGVNISSVSDDVEDDDYYGKDRTTGKLPTTLFHGTSNENFELIMRVGLRPDRRESNWASIGVSHPELIFGTVDQAGAEFHANKSADIHTGNGESYGDPYAPFPVVFEFKVPDQNLIVPDYDVASEILGHSSQTDDLGYTSQSSGGFAKYSDADDVAAANPEGRTWKSTGIFGYKGWIPPSYIIRVITPFFDGPFGDTNVWSGPPSEYAAAQSREADVLFGGIDDEEFEESNIIKLSDLTEAPIGDYATIGNWGDQEKSNSFSHGIDRKIIQSENVIKKVRKKFGNTDHVLNFYFVNLPGMRKYAEAGFMTPEEVAKSMPVAWKLIQEREQQQGTDAAESINVIFVGNAGANRVAMTAWIMAHRIGHAVKNTRSWKDYVDDFTDSVKNMLESVYDIPVRKNAYGGFDGIGDLELSRFYEAIGGMASARNGKLGGRPAEFYYELFAQYITTGKITMRELPKKFGSRNRVYRAVDEETRDYYSRDLIDDGYGITDQWGDRIDNVMYGAVGRYIVM